MWQLILTYVTNGISNKRNNKRLNNRAYSLFFLMRIFLKLLKHLIPNILKWQDCNIFTKLVPSQTSSRSSHWRCSVKKVFLKICEVSQKNICVGVSGHQACNFIKKRLQHMCFPVKFHKFLRTPILKNICERLLLSFRGFTRLNHNVFLWLRGDIVFCIITS